MSIESELEPTNTARSVWLVGALGLSVLLHVALLLIKGVQPLDPEPSMELIVSLQLAEPETPPDAPEPEPPPEAVTPQELPPEPEPAETTRDSQTDELEQILEPENEAEAEQPSTSESEAQPMLTTRLLSDIRESLGNPTMPEQPDAVTPARIPALPDPLSWIDQYVGRVESSRELWQNPDGSRQGRIVTESGQVYCGKARAPTTDEIFNSSRATNIMLWRDCGQIRPDPPDLSNPRLRTPRP